MLFFIYLLFYLMHKQQLNKTVTIIEWGQEKRGKAEQNITDSY